jgi:hypothetical protein
VLAEISTHCVHGVHEVETVEGCLVGADAVEMALFKGGTGVLVAVCLEFDGHLGHYMLGGAKFVLKIVYLAMEQLNLLPLPLTGVVGGKTVTLHTLYAALLLLILRLGTLIWG